MTPTIRISENTYRRLQNPLIAKPFDDTPATAIDKLLDFFEKHNSAPQTSEFAGDRFYPRALFGMKGLTWNGLVKVANKYAFDHASSFEEFRRLTNSNVEKGESTDRGFHHFREIDISIQYVDAEHAWKNILYIAKKLKVAITIEFEWDNQQRGILAWTPTTK